MHDRPLSRRSLFTGLALLALAGPAVAAEATRQVELKKVFPYLEAYYALPAAARTRFALAYRMKLSGPGALRLAYVRGSERVEAALGPDGRVLRLPTPAMYRDGYKVEATTPAGVKISIDLEVEPTLRPATELDARELAAAVRQAAEGVRKSAGVLGFAAPKMERVVFKGAQGGVMVTASGQSRPLAVVKGSPVFDPAKSPDAVRIRFSRAPGLMAIGPAK